MRAWVVHAHFQHLTTLQLAQPGFDRGREHGAFRQPFLHAGAAAAAALLVAGGGVHLQEGERPPRGRRDPDNSVSHIEAATVGNDTSRARRHILFPDDGKRQAMCRQS